MLSFREGVKVALFRKNDLNDNRHKIYRLKKI